MGQIEQLDDKAPKANIKNLAELKQKVEQLKQKELAPEDERTAVLANSLEQLAELNNNVRNNRYTDKIAPNPPVYELLT